MRYFSFALVVMCAISSTDPTSAGTFELSIKLDSAEIVVGEPVFATIRARNASDKAARFAMSGGEYHLEFYLQHGDAEFTKIRVKADALSSGPGQSVQPGETVSKSVLFASRFVMSDNRLESASVFDRVGIYRLKWAHQYELTQVMSNTVSIKVVRGKAEDEEAQSIYTHGNMRRWLELRDDDADQQLGKLNRIIERYPSSTFVDHAHMRLAEYFDTKSYVGKNNTTRDEDNVWLVPEVKSWVIARVLHHYTAVSERNPSLRARALYAAAAFAFNHSLSLPDGFDIDELLTELEKHSAFADGLALNPVNAEKIRSRLRELQKTAPKQ